MRPVAIGILLLAWTAAGATPAVRPRAEIASLAWLAGCWTGGSGGRQVEEHWMRPSGGTMLGMSRTVADGKTVESEFIEIRQRGEALLYVARPSRQPEASFTWVSGSPTFKGPRTSGVVPSDTR